MQRAKDWDDYDRLVEKDKRLALIIHPDHMYRTFLNKDWPGMRNAPGGR